MAFLFTDDDDANETDSEDYNSDDGNYSEEDNAGSDGGDADSEVSGNNESVEFHGNYFLLLKILNMNII